MTNLTELPSDLPQPFDDGAANHLVGMKLPHLTLQATTGVGINVGTIPGLLVVYCYPMTGQPNVALPEGWDQIPGARGLRRRVALFGITIKRFKTLVRL